MRYTEFKVGNEEYKLRLTTNEAINCEKKLGKPLLAFMMRMANIDRDGMEALPELSELLLILHASMIKLNHGITLEKVYDIYDEYVDDDGSMFELIFKLVEVMKVSGFFKNVENVKTPL